MTTVLPVGQPTAELAELATSVAQYLGAADSSRLSDADLVVELRALEVLRRQLQAADIPLVTEIDRRNLGAKHGARSTKGLLQDALRLSPRDARDRADCAQLLGSRVTLTGQTLPPLLPRTAAAHAGGLISADHVRAVLATVADLPAQLPPTELDQSTES